LIRVVFGVEKKWVAGLMPTLREKIGNLKNEFQLTKQAQLEQPLFN